jgi:GAF domain-containing protein
MSASYPPPANKSSRMWTERDDELPAFMADMLAIAISSEALEAAIPPEKDAVSIDAGDVRAAA